MNDTHGVNGTPWTGFDLDGTLAVYDIWKGIDHIGAPVKPMVDLMKRMHDEGKVVKILTARVAPRAEAEIKPNPYYGELPDGFRLDVPHVLGEGARVWCENRYHEERWDAQMFIVDWCARNLGFIPEITHEKNHLMVNLYDDRVTQVVPNRGITLEDALDDAKRTLFIGSCQLSCLRAKVESKFNGFFAGFMFACCLYALINAGFAVYDHYFKERTPAQQRIERLHEAVHGIMDDWPEDCGR